MSNTPRPDHDLTHAHSPCLLHLVASLKFIFCAISPSFLSLVFIIRDDGPMFPNHHSTNRLQAKRNRLQSPWEGIFVFVFLSCLLS